jgi:lauroyl/myristoyl acyltransferase
VTDRERRLEAPHRRIESSSRLLERGVVLGYRAVAWIAAHVPPAIPREIIGRASQVSYLLWPTKRRWSSANFARVLGLPPGHRRVHLTALAAYREYARYVVELMRLPHLPRSVADELVVGMDLDVIERAWRSAPGGGLIFALGHIGNAEMAAAGISARGWPINVLADDSTFPEMFELFRRTREQWGVHVIPWRNLREIYVVLRRREMLGLFVDWGYRHDGVPVRLFGQWTALPSGPATLAAKTGSVILPIAIRRVEGGRKFHIEAAEPITVPSTAPADILAATQRMADALAEAVAAAPTQWYSFKPIWPSDPAEAAELERRAAAMASGTDAAAEPRPAGAEAAT